MWGRSKRKQNTDTFLLPGIIMIFYIFHLNFVKLFRAGLKVPMRLGAGFWSKLSSYQPDSVFFLSKTNFLIQKWNATSALNSNSVEPGSRSFFFQ